MLYNNSLSIFRRSKSNLDYCLLFAGDGYISIDDLCPFLDHRLDFSFSMEFKVDFLPSTGYSFLMNSCLIKSDNKIGIALDLSNLYVQIDKGHSVKTELSAHFSEPGFWHIISVSNSRGALSASLDGNQLESNIPSVSLPGFLGFRIASDASGSQNLTGCVNNILLTDLSNPVAQYNLNEGSGTKAFDSISHYDGSITNGIWSSL